ncbi:MAG: alpha/beta hydrolase-fold protein [Pseudomonadota bacterium]
MRVLCLTVFVAALAACSVTERVDDETASPETAAAEETTAAEDTGVFLVDPADPLPDPKEAGVLGELIYWRDVPSQFMEPDRHVEIWLPPGYREDSERRYPVIYMADGQNLFDPRLSYTRTDWGVDESIVRLMNAGEIEPAIVVGVWNTERRAHEYSPWHGAPDYARFLIEELIPKVNAEFRTLTGPENTMHAGSSMGGLISWHMVKEHPDVFGSCGCVSTHVSLSDWQIANYIGQIEPKDPEDRTLFIDRSMDSGPAPSHGRYWFDWGTAGLDATYPEPHARLRDWYLAAGHIEGETVVFREYPGADHNETAWRARADDVFRFLLSKNDT